MRQLNDKVCVLLLCAPIVLSILRKLSPGMSASIEALEYVIVCAALFCMLLYHRKSKPLDGFVRFCLVCLTLIYVVCLFLTMQYGMKMFLVTAIVRLVPMAVVLLSIKVYDLEGILRKVVWFYLIFGLIMLPFAALGAIAGQSALPRLFAVGEYFEEIGKSMRFGMPVYYGVFYSNVVLSYTYYAIGVVCLFLLEREIETGRRLSLLYLVTLIVAFLLVLLAAKRLTLLLLVFGAVLTWFRAGAKGGRILSFVGMGFLALLMPLGVYLLSKKSTFNLLESLSSSWEQATGGYVQGILMNLLLPRIKYFSDNIIGAGLGAAGPEAINFAPGLWLSHAMVPEMGLVMWMIELGVFGAIIAFICWSGMLLRLRKLFWTSDRQLYVFVFALSAVFMFKHLNTIIGPYVHIMLFWFVIGTLSVSLRARMVTGSTPYPMRMVRPKSGRRF